MLAVSNKLNKKTPWIKGDIHDEEQMKEIVVFLEMTVETKVGFILNKCE